MLFDNLLGKKKPDEALGNAGARSGAHIQYSPKLVPDLQAEHRALLDGVDKLGQAHAAGDLAVAADLLEKLGGQLTAHLLLEDSRFYGYLEKGLVRDPRTRALVRQFRREMGSAGKIALSFLAKYRNIAEHAAFPGDFAADLASLVDLLRERIEREERTLYPMYLPAY